MANIFGLTPKEEMACEAVYQEMQKKGIPLAYGDIARLIITYRKDRFNGQEGIFDVD